MFNGSSLLRLLNIKLQALILFFRNRTWSVLKLHYQYLHRLWRKGQLHDKQILNTSEVNIVHVS